MRALLLFALVGCATSAASPTIDEAVVVRGQGYRCLVQAGRSLCFYDDAGEVPAPIPALAAPLWTRVRDGGARRDATVSLPSFVAVRAL